MLLLCILCEVHLLTFPTFDFSCGVMQYELSPLLIAAGCVVIENEVSDTVRYPECCGIHVSCPSLDGDDI